MKSPTAGPSLHLVGLDTMAPRICHTIRYAGGSWQQQFGWFGDRSYTSVACAGVDTELHVVALASGQLVLFKLFPRIADRFGADNRYATTVLGVAQLPAKLVVMLDATAVA